MNVYDKAHELAQALNQSNEYKSYKVAKDKVYADEKTKKMLMDFKRKQFQLQAAYMEGREPEKEQVEKLQQLAAVLQYNADISSYMAAEYRFNQVMTDIYKIIGDAVEIDFDFMQEKE